MPRYFAFLRAINVGGHTVKMDTLRQLFASLGLSNVETFIASGNVIFETRARSEAPLVTRIEHTLHAALGYPVAVFLRSDAELAAIAAYRPFPDPALAAAVALNIGFLAEPLDDASLARALALQTENDDLHLHGREIYWLARVRQSDSAFSGALFEKTVRRSATFRGLKTIQRLSAKYPPRSPSAG